MDKYYITRITDSKNKTLLGAYITCSPNQQAARDYAKSRYAFAFGASCPHPVEVTEITPEVIWDAAEQSFRNSDDVNIMVAGRVFLTDLEQLPDTGVPIEDGVEFEFNGHEILASDLGLLDDGEPFVDGCQDEMHYRCTNDAVIEAKKL